MEINFIWIGDEGQKYYKLDSKSSSFYPSIRIFSSTLCDAQNAILQEWVYKLEKHVEDGRSRVVQLEMQMKHMVSSMMEEVIRLVRDLPTPSPSPRRN